MKPRATTGAWSLLLTFDIWIAGDNNDASGHILTFALNLSAISRYRFVTCVSFPIRSRIPFRSRLTSPSSNPPDDPRPLFLRYPAITKGYELSHIENLHSCCCDFSDFNDGFKSTRRCLS